MGKLKLSLEHLAVETFTTDRPGSNRRGTVHAHDSFYETWEGYSCVYAETCQNWRTCYIDCTMDCTFRWNC
ncbi:MAG TPA: hypothetical protein VF006_13920 [Longimicrobium sp.]